jgi:hypothetical protein
VFAATFRRTEGLDELSELVFAKCDYHMFLFSACRWLSLFPRLALSVRRLVRQVVEAVSIQ